MIKKGVRQFLAIRAIASIVVLGAAFLAVQDTKAASLANVSIRLDRMAAGATTGGTVCARPIGAGTETTVKISFPAGFTVNGTASNWTVSTTNLPANPAGYTVAAWPGIATATLVATQDVTFPSTDLTPGTTIYCFNFNNNTTLTNATAGIDKIGVITTQAAGPSAIDTASYALATITDDTITVTATVPPNFSFAIAGGNTDTFSGNLSAGSVVSTAGKTATIITNASNGWVAWVKSASASGLTSQSTGANIPVAATVNDNAATVLTPGTSAYVVDVSFTDAGGGSTGVVSQASNYGAEFDGNGTTSGGSTETTFRPIAAASGITAGDTITLTERVAISALQQAASDYTDTLTLIAAGRF